MGVIKRRVEIALNLYTKHIDFQEVNRCYYIESARDTCCKVTAEVMI
jgi:hypothetical protein